MEGTEGRKLPGSSAGNYVHIISLTLQNNSIDDNLILS
jgi:hypothetical protein